MYSTVKAIHVEIMNRISLVTSNRHKNMAPQYIDMMLNRSAIKYINLNLVGKINYIGEGFDESQRRVDNLQSLKVETGFDFVRVNEYSDRGYIVLPSDYLNLIRSDSRIIFSKYNLEDKKVTTPIRRVGTKIHFHGIELDSLSDINGLYLDVIYDDSGTINQYNISNLLQFLQTEDNPFDINLFEFINLFMDRLRDLGLNVYWEYFLDEYSPNTLYIFKNSHDVDVELKFIRGGETRDIGVWSTEKVSNWEIFELNGDRIVQNDLIGTDEITNTKGNFYMARNRHRAPITEIKKGKLYVYFGREFITTSVKLAYIKRPKLFNIEINQMSDLIVTPEFIDLTVSEILLNLKDNSFNIVKQQSNLI